MEVVQIDPGRLGVGAPADTFHGRDIFAPAAGMLAAGEALDALGDPIQPPGALARIPFPRLSVEGLGVRGEVICADRFGNLVTSIGILDRVGDVMELRPWTGASGPVRMQGAALRALLPDGGSAPLRRTFSDAPPGSAIAYVGSDGLLEVGVNRGSAADAFGLLPGSDIVLSAE